MFVFRNEARVGVTHLLAEADSEFLHHFDSFFLVFCTGHPEVFLVLHDVSEDGASHEHHVLSTWRILNTDFEFLQKKI